jgi:hypothetical protein
MLRQEPPQDRKGNTELFIAAGEVREGAITIGLLVYFSEYMPCIMNTLARTSPGSVYILYCVCNASYGTRFTINANCILCNFMHLSLSAEKLHGRENVDRLF